MLKLQFKHDIDIKLVPQGLLYTRTDFLPKEITKIRPKTRFNTNKNEVAQIPYVIYLGDLEHYHTVSRFRNYLSKKYMTNPDSAEPDASICMVMWHNFIYFWPCFGDLLRQ